MDGSPLDRAVFVGLEAAALIVLSRRSRLVGKTLRANGPILLFFLYCGLSILWSDFPAVAFKRWTKALGDLMMVLIILSDRDPLMAIKRILTRITYVLIPLSVLFIKYYPALGTRYGPWGGKAANTGVTTNKNILGAVCLCLGLGALWRFLAACRSGREVSGRTRQMLAQGIVLAMVLWLFKTANSMTSLTSFLMAGVLLVAANLRWVIRRPVVVPLLILSMLAVSATVVFLGANPDALKAMGRDPTLTDRTEVWGVLLAQAQSPLLGTGFESYWLGPRLARIWSIYWWRPNEAHNGYLEIYLNLGWVGLILLLVVIVGGYRTVFEAWRKNDPTGSFWLALFYVGLVYNFTEAAYFRMNAPAWIFILVAITRIPAITYRKAKWSEEDATLDDGAPRCVQGQSTYRAELV